jgi:hypothetical protein
MKRKRPKPKAQKPPPGPPPSLQYKVVELSTVDESSLERTVNVWVRAGWTLENVQFAMRESSKRPAMAFVFFTRADVAAEHDEHAARAHLARLANEPSEAPTGPNPASAYARLVELARDDDEDAR